MSWACLCVCVLRLPVEEHLENQPRVYLAEDVARGATSQPARSVFLSA